MNKFSLRVFYTIFISFFAFLSCTNNKTNEKAEEKQSFKSVDVLEFKNVIADTANVMLIDVRTADEFNAGHIETAINIDVKRSDFESIANTQLPKDKTLAIYCRSGRRSKTAGEILVKNGYKVIELDSGYNGWTESQK